MTQATGTAIKQDTSGLTAAITRHANDAVLGRFLEAYRWSVLGEFVHPAHYTRGHVLINQGSTDRTLYFLESGDLEVDVKSDSGQVHLALLGPGNVVGEGSFFSRLSRSASVAAIATARFGRWPRPILICCRATIPP